MELVNNGNTDVDTIYLRFYPNGYVPYMKASFPEENKGKKLSSEIASVVIAGTEKKLPLKYDMDKEKTEVTEEETKTISGGESDQKMITCPMCRQSFPLGTPHYCRYNSPFMPKK